MKDGYELELQAPKTIKLFSKKKIIEKRKNDKNVAGLEVVEVISVQ